MAPFKSTQSFSVGKFLKTFRSRDAVGPAALNSPVRSNRTNVYTASGGTKVLGSDGFTYHIFQKGNTDNFVLTQAPASAAGIEVLLVAGGGGGGIQHGGGGGAGALYHNPSYVIATGSYTFTIGSGGASASGGGDSRFGDVIMNGGGVGGRMANPGGGGGSGGGGGMNNNNPGPANPVPGGSVTAPPSTPTSSPFLKANAGASGARYYVHSNGGIGGGGGGAGSAGTVAPDGPGLQSPE